MLDRHVEVLADQHALAGEIEVGHAEDGHGVVFRRWVGRPLSRLARCAATQAETVGAWDCGSGVSPRAFDLVVSGQKPAAGRRSYNKIKSIAGKARSYNGGILLMSSPTSSIAITSASSRPSRAG